ncbi:AMP-dependent synthetase and ligase [Sphaerisporangium krabiense]|uniref:Acyl-CoA synthetase (AMP-forming)/AMP-acid ligase II n=1 Tax=Sphaerisporangium krabiense TaxID=763782 RepID=A0A7W8Z6L8_9ACTN|nr:AMP-binding protein [Sphaerisporangium krabiense]MBB5628309.1 acyl-CoA synthetase (AMP-forming)/AMP-acid ligase II [Sphaerisporangium krabiense]GII66306.1 AMP-dependent synthetase and ligase [Sphaerisporangium krabiense]
MTTPKTTTTPPPTPTYARSTTDPGATSASDLTGGALLHDLVDEAARRWPDGPAVSAGTDTLTYAELYWAGLSVAERLRRRGVRRGDRVVVSAPATPAVAACLYGISRLGAVFVVLHEQTDGDPLRHVLTDCEPALVITTGTSARRTAHDLDIPSATPQELVVPLTPSHDRGVPLAAPHRQDVPLATPHHQDIPLRTPQGPGVSLATPNDIGMPGTVSTTAGTPDGRGFTGEAGSGVLEVDPVCLIYTSGTTGRPKAVVTTHRQARFVTGAIRSVLGYRRDDVVYCALPLSFDYGLYQLFLAASCGAHVVLGDAAQAGPLLARTLARVGATVLPAVPSLAEGLARLLRRSSTPGLRLRLLTNTGAAMPPETLAALRAAVPGLRVQLMFGLTECKRAAVMPPDEDLRRPGACGRPLPGTEVSVVDTEGRRLPPGEVGEFVVRGPHVMAGYWRRPELTARRFPRAEGLFPELRTGDYGWLDDDGYLYFDGRRDDIYKERGFRVSATEVEAAARQVEGVESAAVLTPAKGRPAVLVAVTTLHPDDLLAAMRPHLEEFKIPRHCVTTDALPLTRNGKVDRKTLATHVTADLEVANAR